MWSNLFELWRLETFLVIIPITFIILFKIGKKYHPIIALFWAYVVLSGIFIGFFPTKEGIYGDLQIRIDQVAPQSALLAILVPLFVMILKRDSIRFLIFLFELLALLNSILVIFLGRGIFFAYSFDLTFIAMVYPSILFRPEIYIVDKKTGIINTDLASFIYEILLVTLPAIAMIVRPSSTPTIMIAMSLTAYFILTRRSLSFLLVLPVIVSVGVLLSGVDFLSSNGRFEMWEYFFNWWNVWANQWIGTGTGSFQWIGPFMQINEQFKTDSTFHFMHNEYLQILFEQGVIGFSLFLFSIYIAIKRSVQTPWVLASIVAICVCFLTQFPLRWIIPQIWIMIIFRLALENCWRRGNHVKSNK